MCVPARFLLWTFALPLIMVALISVLPPLLMFVWPLEFEYRTVYVHDGQADGLERLRRQVEALAADETMMQAVTLDRLDPPPEGCGQHALVLNATLDALPYDSRPAELLPDWEQRLRPAGLGARCSGLRMSFKSLSVDAHQWLMPLVLMPYAIMILVFHVRSRRGHRPLRLNWSDWQPRACLGAAIRQGVVAGLACLVVAVALAALFETLGWFESDPILPELMAFWPVLLLVDVLAPMAEEFVFRAWMLERLSRVMPAPLALLVSTGVFVAFHAPSSVFGVLNLYLVGLLLGLLWLRTRSLVAVSVGHGAYNGGLLVLQFTAMA